MISYPSHARAAAARHDVEPAQHSGGARTIFFAPAVGLLAEKLGARRCPKPALAPRLVLVHGEPAAWRIHFGEIEEMQRTRFEPTDRLAL